MIGLGRPLAVWTDLPNRLLADQGTSVTLPVPSTHVRAIDRFSVLGITWYEAQLARMAHGEPPKERLSTWGAVALSLRRLGAHAFALGRP